VPDSSKVANNEAASRFEISLDGHLAQLQYKRTPGQIAFIHTEVPKELGGRGLASQLAKTALDFARTNGLEVIPYCPFVASYVKKHTEYADLVPEQHRHLILEAESR
jgi:uncharacterized protein